MPKQTYALEPGGPKRLEISWKGMWKNLTIKVDEQIIGTIAGQKELKQVNEFTLPDNTTLSVQLVQKISGAELQILRDGQALPGSASDPETRLKSAYGIVFVVAGLNLVLGLLATLFQVEFLQSIGIGFFSIIFGLVFLVLGFFVKMMSQTALIIAIVIFGLDAIAGIALSVMGGMQPSIGGLMVRVFLIIPMIQGVPAIRALKQ